MNSLNIRNGKVRNYKLIVQYDGTNYSGWQVQKNAPSVQEKIQEAISVLIKEDVNLIAAGRTDAGVHAWGQVANFRTERELDVFKFQHSLNAILPKDIAIREMAEVPEKFHARFDAIERSYFYFFSFGKSPFYSRFTALNKELQEYDFGKLNKISSLLEGKRDFSSFAKNKTEVKNKVCDLRKIRWRKGTHTASVLVVADRFLHGMVRALIGTILKAYSVEDPAEYFESIFEKRTREAAGQSAQAKGLFLFKIKYPEKI